MKKLIGDVSEEHKKLAKELEELESILDTKVELPKSILSKMFVCLAHDWFEISVDEEGHRMIEKAEKTCPGYFNEVIHRHQKEDPRFELICKNLKSELAVLLLTDLVNK
jgi:hypothetical protein